MGLMLAEPGFHTRCYVEWEEYPRSVIIAAQRAGYFAPAPIWDDLTAFDGRPFCGAIDTILAGYPCQPFSQAGQRRGEDDERHLWPDVARVIREIGPTWVFLENVAGHVSIGLETVLRELWDMGFTPAVGLFTAAETGAPHERERVFIVAHRASEKRAGLRSRTEAQHAITGSRCDYDPVADTGGAERQGKQPGQRDPCGWQEPHGYSPLRGGTGLFPPGPGDSAAWADTVAVAPDLAPATGIGDCLAWAGRLAQAVEVSEQAEIEPSLRRMADGLALRSRALRLLGNGVHPLAAGHAWRTLSAAHGLRPVDMASAEGGHSNRTTVISMIEAAE